jgi:hypothetical protein
VLESDAGSGGYIDELETRRTVRAEYRSQRMKQPQLWDRCEARHPLQKRPSIHGTFTRPARMAYTTNSAVL